MNKCGPWHEGCPTLVAASLHLTHAARMKFLPMTLPLLLLAAAPAQADLLSGRVLDSAGQPLPACNLDVVDVVTGVDVAAAGDTTDAAGQFTIDVPTGLYTVMVNPPPGSAHLVELVDGVAVFGATSMGDVQLEPGAFLGGTILLPSGLPAVGANLDVELAGGEEYFPAGDTTDDNGTFSMVVPLGEVALQVRPETLTTTLLAPIEVELVLAGSANVGTLQLETGYWTSVTVQTLTGAPVFGADLDVLDAMTGAKLFTPGDNTNTAGFADVVVPAGTYLVEVEPRFADGLVATTVGPVPISTTTSMGVVQVEPGVVLSGTVTDSAAALAEGVDLDVFLAGTLTEVTLSMDNSDATGQYAVIVPTGVFDLVFTPDPLLNPGSGITSVTGVTISGDLVVDIQLGTGSSGPTLFCDPANVNSTGQPVTLAASSFSGPGAFHLEATGGPANQFGAFVVAATPNLAGVTISQGLLCLAPPLGRYTSAAGAALNSVGRFDGSGVFQNLFGTSTVGTGFDVPTTLPSPPGGVISAGSTWHFQLWYRDVGGASNFSNGITVDF